MSDPILEVRGLQKHFTSTSYLDRLLGGQAPLRAVDAVDLRLGQHETLALVGESGCGKSTVAKTIMGLYEPTDGEILFEGEPLTKDNVADKPIQMVFQDPSESLNPRRTVGNILATALRLQGVTSVTSRVDELLEEVGLDPKMKNRYPTSFSGGQKQRIAIARSLASDPDVLIADEPVSGLDVSVQAKIIRLLTRLKETEDLSVLLISHNLGVVRSIADRVSVMYLGELVERGETEDVFEYPAHPYTNALLSAIHRPDPDEAVDRVILSGEPPSPRDPPTGCRFNTRCPHRMPGVCDQDHPPFYGESSNPAWPVNGEGHRSRCFLHQDEFAD